MASNVTRDHHNLRRNLKLNGNYISNDGGDEGISISDSGLVTTSAIVADGVAFSGHLVQAIYGSTNSVIVASERINLALNGAVASGQTVIASGIDLDCTANATSGTTEGSVTLVGIDMDITGEADGTQTAQGLDIYVSGADTNNGANIRSVDRQLRLLYDGSSYLDITVADDSDTTLATAESGDLIFDAAGDITFDAGGANVYFINAGTTTIEFDTNGATGAGAGMKLISLLDAGDYFQIDTTTHGATTITTVDDDAANADLILNIDGYVDINSASSENITLDSGGDIYLDAHTGVFRFYDAGDTNDSFKLTVVGGTGATTLETVSAASPGDGHLSIIADGHVEFDGCGVGFDKETTTFAASDVLSEGDDSTDIDFRLGNKHELTLTDDIAGSGEYINMIFPATSGNFILVLIQGVADCMVHSTGWRAYQSDGSTLGINELAENGTDGRVRWAGGTAPTLSTSQYDIDVVSFYWDADNGTALGVASLDFS